VNDEVLGKKRAGCVDAIRDFVDRIGTPGIAVCSRIQEYEALPDRLKLAGAITLPRTRKKQRDPEMHQTKKGNQWFSA